MDYLHYVVTLLCGIGYVTFVILRFSVQLSFVIWLFTSKFRTSPKSLHLSYFLFQSPLLPVVTSRV